MIQWRIEPFGIEPTTYYGDWKQLVDYMQKNCKDLRRITITALRECSDPISPPHYRSATGLEAIEVIEAFGLGYAAGNAVKYILCAGRKGDAAEDYRKAIWYLQRLVERS